MTKLIPLEPLHSNVAEARVKKISVPGKAIQLNYTVSETARHDNSLAESDPSLQKLLIIKSRVFEKSPTLPQRIASRRKQTDLYGSSLAMHLT